MKLREKLNGFIIGVPDATHVKVIETKIVYSSDCSYACEAN